MKKLINLVAGLAAAAPLCAASVSPSCATPETIYFVSGGGNDANACGLSTPCRTIGHAVSTAANGGTVSCLDAGPYYESFSTNVSFTLDCRGVVYTASPSGAFEIATQASALVTIRNVIFDGAGGGGGGFQILSGKVVFENCTFQNFTAFSGQAVQFAPTAAGAYLTITDSVFANNGIGAGGGAIYIQPSGGVTASAVIERTQVANNTYGIVANGTGGTVLVEVRYSTIANNAVDGIRAVGGSIASFSVEHSASVRNGGSGINAQGANSFVVLSDSTVAWNATGLTATGGGAIFSTQNNVIGGNANPGVTPQNFGQQ
jgi:hypothetical protein